MDAALKVNSTSWFLLGMLTGPISLFMISPETEVPAARLVSRTPDYIAKYIQCYEAESVSAKRRYAMSGCFVTTAGVLIGGALLAGDIEDDGNFQLDVKRPAAIPEIQNAVTLQQSSYGTGTSHPLEQLTNSGFTIADQSMNGDTLIIDWAHPDFSKDGHFRIRYREINDQPLSLAWHDSQTAWVISEYHLVENVFIPLQLEFQDKNFLTPINTD